jgi:hypothetical protein
MMGEDEAYERDSRLKFYELKRNVVLLPMSVFYYIHRLDGNYCNPARSGDQHHQ